MNILATEHGVNLSWKYGDIMSLILSIELMHRSDVIVIIIIMTLLNQGQHGIHEFHTN